MNAPFIIYALPRSRTYWTSQFLSYGGRAVAHDIGVAARSCQDFVDRMNVVNGTVETGAMFAHSLLRRAFPSAKVATIRRPVAEVAASLARFGINDVENELAERDHHLDIIEQMGAERFEYADLVDPRHCSDLFEHALSERFDFRHWMAMDAINAQVDMPERLRLLRERHNEIEAVKIEAARLIERGDARFYTIGWEPFRDCHEEVVAMGEAHYLEANNGEEVHCPYKVNVPLLLQNEEVGFFRIMCARVNGALVGYITWSFVPNGESEGVVIADQGAWYVAPAFNGLPVGRKMLERSLADIKVIGIKNINLHHPLNGRGARLGAWFRRMGAVERQRRYSLWLGD